MVGAVHSTDELDRSQVQRWLVARASLAEHFQMSRIRALQLFVMRLAQEEFPSRRTLRKDGKGVPVSLFV